jgi:hypothetical protein
VAKKPDGEHFGIVSVELANTKRAMGGYIKTMAKLLAEANDAFKESDSDAEAFDALGDIVDDLRHKAEQLRFSYLNNRELRDCKILQVPENKGNDTQKTEGLQ